MCLDVSRAFCLPARQPALGCLHIWGKLSSYKGAQESLHPACLACLACLPACPQGGGYRYSVAVEPSSGSSKGPKRRQQQQQQQQQQGPRTFSLREADDGWERIEVGAVQGASGGSPPLPIAAAASPAAAPALGHLLLMSN